MTEIGLSHCDAECLSKRSSKIAIANAARLLPYVRTLVTYLASEPVSMSLVARSRKIQSSHPSKRRQAGWLAGCILLLALYSAKAPEANAQDSLQSYGALHPQTALDTNTVNVTFGSTLYTIPRNYLVGLTQSKAPHTQTSFTIYVLLPDLSPRTEENSSALDRPGWHDQLRVLAQYGKTPRPKEELRRFYLDLAKKSENDFQLVGGQYRFYDLPNNVPHEIYTADTPNGLFLFTCDRKSDYAIIVTPTCTVMEDLGNKVGLTYSFSRDHMMEAADIDAKLRKLLNSFAQK